MDYLMIFIRSYYKISVWKLTTAEVFAWNCKIIKSFVKGLSKCSKPSTKILWGIRSKPSLFLFLMESKVLICIKFYRVYIKNYSQNKTGHYNFVYLAVSRICGRVGFVLGVTS